MKRRQIKIDIHATEDDVGSFIDALGKPEALQGSSRDVESFDSRSVFSSKPIRD